MRRLKRRQRKQHRLAPMLFSLFFAFTSAPAARAYTDTETSWAAEVIQKASDYGLMQGYPDGRFGVGDHMTRAQFVTVLTRMFAWEPVETTATFFDCPASAWYTQAVETAATHDVLDVNGPFRPEDYISRAEMAEMLVRAFGYSRLAQSLDKSSLPFSDVQSRKGYIAMAYDMGIITGVETNGQLNFLPTFSAPREQAAAMLVRAYERLHVKTEWLHGFYATSSYSQLSYTDQMEGVSVGWARLEYDGTQMALNETATNNNGWIKPEGSELVTDYLGQRNIPCHLCVYASAETFSSVMAAGGQAELVQRLVEAARPYGGLTVDFEGMKADQKENFTNFMEALRAALPESQSLFVCVPPANWFDGFDYRALGELCDKVILMAHDYQWSSIPDYYLGTANTYCPVTPLQQVYKALQQVTDARTGVQDHAKIALQISFNTTCFHVDETGNLLDTTFYHPSMKTIAQRLQQPDSVRTWDEASQNASLAYRTEEDEYYLLWYEDAQSVTAKIELAHMFGITSLSVWRLGTIPTFPEIPNYDVWNAFLASKQPKP